MTSTPPPIVYAVLAGDLALVKERIAAGAPLDFVDPRKSTALNQALHRHQLDIADLLLQAGADPNLPDNDGRTPWSSALDHESRALLKRFGAVDPRREHQRHPDREIDFATTEALFRTTTLFEILSTGRWGGIPRFIVELEQRGRSKDSAALASVWESIKGSFEDDDFPPTDDELRNWAEEYFTPDWNLPLFRGQP